MAHYFFFFPVQTAQQIERCGAHIRHQQLGAAGGFFNYTLILQLNIGDLAGVHRDKSQLSLRHLLQAGTAGDIAHLGCQIVIFTLSSGKLVFGFVDLAVEFRDLGLAVHHADNQPQQQRHRQHIQGRCRQVTGPVQTVPSAAYHLYVGPGTFHLGCGLAGMQ